MKKFPVTIDLELEDAESKVLGALFDCEQKDLAEKLAPYVNAAAHEYIDMFTGAAPITTAVDVRERRLVSIIRNGLGEIPKTALIARLFKLTPAAASSLIRNVSAKHQVKVAHTFNATLYATVKAAMPLPDKKDGKLFAVIRDPVLVKLLNDLLGQAEESQTSIKLVEDSANKYSMDPSSHQYLLSALAPHAG